MAMPDVVETVTELRARLAPWRKAGETVALVPTMGALHAGHLSLVDLANRSADRTVVSIFVNPTQFAPHEDLASYPRNLEADLESLAGTDVDLVFAPKTTEMYPEGAGTVVTVSGPSAGLESDARPHFFAGVATVVAKLLIQCAPDVATFGEKDFQQVAVVRRLVRDLSLPVEILSAPTMREPDGLAMSSRNVYLGPDDRARAPALHRTLRSAAADLVDGRPALEALHEGMAALRKAGFEVDYLEFRDAVSLEPIARFSGGEGRLLAAARIGGVRLIDNVRVAAITGS